MVFSLTSDHTLTLFYHRASLDGQALDKHLKVQGKRPGTVLLIHSSTRIFAHARIFFFFSGKNLLLEKGDSPDYVDIVTQILQQKVK